MSGQDTPKTGRRAFLRGAVAAGGAAAAAGVAAVAVNQGSDSKAAAEGAVAASETRGYHETPHIRTYYRLARL